MTHYPRCTITVESNILVLVSTVGSGVVVLGAFFK